MQGLSNFKTRGKATIVTRSYRGFSRNANWLVTNMRLSGHD